MSVQQALDYRRVAMAIAFLKENFKTDSSRWFADL